MKLSERVRLDPKRKKSNGNPYFFLPVSTVTAFKIFDQKLNKITENGFFFCLIASSKIYIFMSYHKLFFQVLLRIKSTSSLQNIFSFLLNHSCASKLGGISSN